VHEQDGFFRSGGACAELGGTGFPTSQFTNDTSGYSKGSLTGSAVTVSGSSTKIYKGYYYDVKGRVTKVVQNNLLGGYDVTNTVYTFTGQPATVTHSHTASGKSTRTEVYTYSYDHADRVSKVEHTLGGTKITLADYTYDSFGRLSTKSLHGSAANKLTYAYNLRSWLTGITSTRFTQNLYYNTGVGTARYNGNISSMTWKSGNESTVRGYKFTYDGLDRMLNATYGETAGISTNANRFSENVTGYDKNGNIKGLQRYGQLSSAAYGMIDNLTLTLNGNQLNRVDDAVTASAYNGGFEFKNGANAADEYSYDANGNLTKDLNKGISGITYNFLNLPNVVTFSDGSTITYTYGADGTKLRTVHKIGSTTTTTDYCGNVVYENGVQKLLLTEEGYVTLSDSKYHYYLKDHQGNNRVVISQSGTVEETNHYYPFGGAFASTSNVQPYKYNGKELDSKKGLNWYDYGARHYDAALGRFTTNDRFAEKYYSMSPYQYGANNPVNNIDVNGDTIVVNPNPNGLIDNVRIFFGFDTKYQKDVKADLQQLKKDDKEIGEMIIELEKSKNVHSITRTKRGKSNSSGFDREKAKKDIPQGSIINYDPDVKTDINGNHRTPRIGLSHELQHSSDVDKGIMSYENIGNGIPMREIRAINTENKIRKRTGDAKRTEYRGRKIPQKLLE
jgi:RHS repeat-associated protein